MTTTFDVYDVLRQLTDKSGKGFVSPEEAGNWMELVQLDIVNGLRSNGSLDQTTQNALAPFIKYPDYSYTSSAAGHFAKPGDFMQVARITNSSGKTYTPILFSELRDAMLSALEPIEDYPRYQEQGNYIILFPQSLTTGTLAYYRLPTKPVVGYNLTTYASTGEIVYDAATTVELELPKAYWPELVKRCLAYLGVTLSDADLFAFSQSAANDN